MTDEEKKAIERLDKRLTIEKYTKNIGTPVYIDDLKIALNLIQKQQEELTRKKADLQNSWHNNLELAEKCLKKDKIIDEIYKCFYKIWCKYPGTGMKILKDNGFDDYKCSICETKSAICVDCIKQYFEKKVGESSK